ncbi:alpha/beta fold hydrolase [Ramlibacter sp. WS9]|uniref:alpha/beta fold hydrolase n=1 Tax=Ramlibacter sp. WS9 TaxID=1882741 RepID=UPI001143E818|nr:alpha/beta fold hydrolase [Ramlibacter sp. WS9]ROZ79704.1 alpha/beta fold hydrolase [Ramlibacter sp. WS9]
MTRLILLPGLAADETMWEAQVPALAPWAPIVADVHAQPHETIEAMAAALLVTHEGPLVLCGASMGGMIAMEAARQAPQRITGLALLGTSARPETPDMRKLREGAIELFAQGRVAEVIEPNVAFAFHPDQARDAVLVRSYIDFVLRAGADQLIRQNRAVIVRPDARTHLAAVRCPTLVMCGDSDQLAPPECSLEIAALVPGAQLKWVPRCGHMLTMERPDVVNAELVAWLESLSLKSLKT